MHINTLLDASQVIGRGLEQHTCRLELYQIGGDGVFWQRRDAPEGSGLWCPRQDWQQALQALTLIAEPHDVPMDLLPLVSAAMFDSVGDWLVDALEPLVQQHGLMPEIYPVLTVSGPTLALDSAIDVRCVLVNWPQPLWQEQVAMWTPFAGKSANVTLSLVAGYGVQTTASPVVPEVGAGVWLDGDVQVEKGEALLWGDDRPLAKVRLLAPVTGDRAELVIESLSPQVHFSHPPLLANLGHATLSLAQLGGMMAGDTLKAEISLDATLNLTHQNNSSCEIVAYASLLRSESGLLAQVNTLCKN